MQSNNQLNIPNQIVNTPISGSIHTSIFRGLDNIIHFLLLFRELKEEIYDGHRLNRLIIYKVKAAEIPAAFTLCYKIRIMRILRVVGQLR